MPSTEPPAWPKPEPETDEPQTAQPAPSSGNALMSITADDLNTRDAAGGVDDTLPKAIQDIDQFLAQPQEMTTPAMGIKVEAKANTLFKEQRCAANPLASEKNDEAEEARTFEEEESTRTSKCEDAAFVLHVLGGCACTLVFLAPNICLGFMAYSRSEDAANRSTCLSPGQIAAEQSDAQVIAEAWADLLDQVHMYGIMVFSQCAVKGVVSGALLIRERCTCCEVVALLCHYPVSLVLWIVSFYYLANIWMSWYDVWNECEGNKDYEGINIVVNFATVVLIVKCGLLCRTEGKFPFGPWDYMMNNYEEEEGLGYWSSWH